MRIVVGKEELSVTIKWMGEEIIQLLLMEGLMRRDQIKFYRG